MKRLRRAGIKSSELKIEPNNIKNKVNAELNADLRERKVYMKSKILKTTVIAMAITILLATSVFAMSPAGQTAINSIIAYFSSEKAAEMTDVTKLVQYNEEIGKSFSKDGYTLTLDNVAADDNFIHVFYTIKSDSVPFYEGDSIDAAIYSDAVNNQMITECMINGSYAGRGNHNSYDGYFEDNYTYKAASKYNVAVSDIPDNFKVELYADIVSKEESVKNNAVISKLYDDKLKQITDDERASVWYISADVDKSKVKLESITKEIGVRLNWSGAMIEKAVFSPFGNQLVVSTEKDTADDAIACIDNFALYDENDIALDILNTDLTSSTDDSSRNSLEFLKADKNTKQLKFVPIIYLEHGDSDVTEQKIGTYPLEYQISDYGKIVVTDIRISDGMIEIDYYKDGFVMYDPGFVLTDENGKNAEPEGKLGCTLYNDVHYDTNSYTARYVYEEYTKDGRKVSFSEKVSADKIKESFINLGVYKMDYIKLDFDKAVTVNF